MRNRLITFSRTMAGINPDHHRHVYVMAEGRVVGRISRREGEDWRYTARLGEIMDRTVYARSLPVYSLRRMKTVLRDGYPVGLRRLEAEERAVRGGDGPCA